MASSREIVRGSSEIQIKRSALVAVAGEVVRTLELEDFDLERDFPVLWAESALASEKSRSSRTFREDRLARMRSVLPAVYKGVNRGLIHSDKESALLGSTLMNVDMHPSSAMRYLSGTSNSLVKRTLTPTELASSLSLYQEVIDGMLDTEPGSTPTLANIILAADNLGIDLQKMDLDDAEIITANIEAYDFSLTVSRADKDGTPYSTIHRVAATSTAVDPIGFALISPDAHERDDEFEEFFVIHQ